jgi:hypothetical protein
VPYTIQYLPDRGYTIATFKKQVTPELALELMVELLDVANKQKCSRFLVDLRGVPVMASTIDTFELPGRLTKVGFAPEHRLAIVYSNNESDHKFLETVSQNRGLQIKAFDDLNEAENWLK